MRTICAIAAALFATSLHAQEITVATWNIENFREHFEGHSMDQKFARDRRSPELDEAIRMVSFQNTEEQWEIASVILEMKPDVLMMQEAAAEDDLRFFNRKWLKGVYETVVVFPSNTTEDRQQNLAMFLKKGFKLIETKAEYYLEKDPAGPGERGDRLFARGPAFVLIESPGGYRFWCGNTHQKSKSTGTVPGLPNILEGQKWETVKMDDESQKKKIEATKWRNREAQRTNQIVQELRKAGPDDVVLVGDMNDDYGVNRFDQEGGGDTIAVLMGGGEGRLELLTKPLVEAGKYSFAGYWKTNERGFVDHVLVTPEMKDQAVEVKVFENAFTPVASDHLPVIVRFRAE